MESSSSTARGGFLSSPRAQRRLIWVSSGVFLVGLIVFLAAFAFRGSSGIHSPISNTKAQHAPKLVKARPDPQAYKVARKFLQTAVLRKNLDAAYPLVGHDLKGGVTKQQWVHGTNPVDPYPAENTDTAGFEVISSYKTQMMLLVDLVARPGAHVRPHLPFWLGLVRAHNKPNGRWLVNYWVPDWAPPLPTNR